MYARLTRLPFEPADRETAEPLWSSEPMQVIGEQPGFRASIVLSSIEDGASACTALTLWDDAEDFERFYSGDHTELNQPIRDSGMAVTHREAAKLLAVTLPEPGEVRRISLQLHEEEAPEVLQFWKRTGKKMVQEAPGNLGAWAAYEPNENVLELTFAWRKPEDGEEFRLSQEHVDVFAPGLGRRTSLIELRRLDFVL